MPAKLFLSPQETKIAFALLSDCKMRRLTAVHQFSEKEIFVFYERLLKHLDALQKAARRQSGRQKIDSSC